MSRIVRVEWSYPKTWESAINYNQGESNGVYQICRTWAKAESLLYIGLVKSDRRSFFTRMNEHRKEWLCEKRGKITYRFGKVSPLSGLKLEPQLIEEVEGALILKLQPPFNIKKKRSFSLREEFVVESMGSRGFAPSKLDTSTAFA